MRLTGCPMRCVWCDSEYTFTGGEKMEFGPILEKLEGFGCNLVEVTGGEPLAQKNVFPFIAKLCDLGYEVLVESGNFVSTKELDPRAKLILDVKCPGSGESERNHWENLERLVAGRDEVKFVVADLADVEYAVSVAEDYGLLGEGIVLLISPVFGIPEIASIAERCTSLPEGFRLNMQLHKYIWGPEAKGV
ncbi:MAG: radical SAM protein [Pyrinomonadaceae bacterium]